MLKAIETQYKGYRFRSRLEARWAVFFDSLGLIWTYEQEGYNLDGVWYLPDFYLSSHEIYVEIKPEGMSPFELSKCELLANSSGKAVLAIQGNPWPGEYSLRLCLPSDAHESGIYDLDDAEFGSCRKCEALVIVQNDDSESGLGWSQFEQCIAPCECQGEKYPIGASNYLEWGHLNRRIIKAFSAARGARFEHGESPR